MGDPRDSISGQEARRLLDVLDEPLLVCDGQEVIRFANQAAARLLERRPAEIAGESFQSVVAPRLRGGTGRGLGRFVAPERERSAGGGARTSLVRRDGVEVDVELVMRELQAGKGEPLSLVILRPLPDERAFVEPDTLSSARAVEEETYRLVFDHAPLGIFHFDAAGVLTACNDRFVRIIGSTKRALVGLNMLTLPDARIVEAVRSTLAGRRAHYEGDYKAVTSGKVTPVRVDFAAIRGNAGAVVGGVAVVEDVTERKEMAARLAQADRMASVGTLAAGVAHEVNNPLAYVIGSLDLCKHQLDALRDATEQTSETAARLGAMNECVANAREGADRVRIIVRDLVTFSRAPSETPMPVDVEAVLDSSVNLAWNEIRHRARLVKSYAGVPPVFGDEARLGQVFVNLLINAAQAIPEGNVHDAEIRLSTRQDGAWAVIEVEDTGCGMPPDVASRIFEPFFTTKAIGVGTGLGLAICHGIVGSLGGQIDASSKPGEGSCFRVRLPLAEGTELEVAPKTSADATGPMRRARILIIDDEPLLGQTLRLAFEGKHDVVVATSGRQGLAELENPGEFDLILCDLMMPDVSGIAVFEQATRVRPKLVRRFVFMTGGAFTDRAREFLERHPGARLEKPFEMRQVEELLRDRQR
jgi:PAS domain S-box-containing protein